MRNLRANALDGTGCSFFAAQAERKAKRKRECYHDTRKERLDEGGRDLELVERCHDGEDPDGPLRDRAGEISSMGACRTRCAAYQSFHHFSHYSAEDKDEDRHYDLREVQQDDLLQEDGDVIETQDIERSNEKYQNHEP